MKIVYSGSFVKSADSLPNEIQEKLDALLVTLAEDPFHPTLHTKRLSGKLNNFYSFRIAKDWRVVFAFVEENTLRLAAVGHRKDIYR